MSATASLEQARALRDQALSRFLRERRRTRRTERIMAWVEPIVVGLVLAGLVTLVSEWAR